MGTVIVSILFKALVIKFFVLPITVDQPRNVGRRMQRAITLEWLLLESSQTLTLGFCGLGVVIPLTSSRAPRDGLPPSSGLSPFFPYPRIGPLWSWISFNEETIITCTELRHEGLLCLTWTLINNWLFRQRFHQTACSFGRRLVHRKLSNGLEYLFGSSYGANLETYETPI